MIFLITDKASCACVEKEKEEEKRRSVPHILSMAACIISDFQIFHNPLHLLQKADNKRDSSKTHLYQHRHLAVLPRMFVFLLLLLLYFLHQIVHREVANLGHKYQDSQLGEERRKREDRD